MVDYKAKEAEERRLFQWFWLYGFVFFIVMLSLLYLQGKTLDAETIFLLLMTSIFMSIPYVMVKQAFNNVISFGSKWDGIFLRVTEILISIFVIVILVLTVPLWNMVFGNSLDAIGGPVIVISSFIITTIIVEIAEHFGVYNKWPLAYSKPKQGADRPKTK